MVRYILLSLLILGLLLAGCSKKDEEIQALERQRQADSIKAAQAKPAVDTTAMMADRETSQKPKAPVKKESPYNIHADYSNLDGFVAQIGAYAEMGFAEMIAEKYQKREYPAFITTAEIDGKTYYRVRVGVYETKEEAEKIGKLIKDRFSADYWVDSNR